MLAFAWLLIGNLLAWRHAHELIGELLGAESREVAATAAHRFDGALRERLSELSRLADGCAVSGDGEREACFLALAEDMTGTQPQWVRLYFIDSSEGTVSSMPPVNRDEGANAETEGVLAVSGMASLPRAMALPRELGGDARTALLLPVGDDASKGVVAGVLDFDALVEDAVSAIDSESFRLRFLALDEEAWEDPELAPGIPGEAAHAFVQYLGQGWRLAVSPARDSRFARLYRGNVGLLLANLSLSLSAVLLLAGVLIFIDRLRRNRLRLRRSERQVHLAQFTLDHAGDAVFWVDEQARFMYVNRVPVRILGYSEEELQGMTLFDIDLSVTPEKWREYWERCAETPALTIETEHRTRKGATFPVELVLNRLQYDSAQYMCIIARDVSERRKAHEALRESEQQKELVLSSISEHVVFHDTSMRTRWANRAAAESAGLAPEEMQGRHCYETWHRQSEPCEGCAVVAALETGEIQRREFRTPDGRVWNMRAYPVKDAQRELAGVVEVSQEITERMHAEEALRASEERHRRLLRTIPHGVAECDRHGCIIFVNESLVRMLGCGAGELLGKNIWELHATEEGRRYIEDYVAKLLHDQPEPRAYRAAVTAADETVKHIQVDWNYIRDAEGGITGLITVFTDVTEQEKAEEEAKLHREQLIQADKMVSLGVLVSGVAHEINNPNHFIMSHVTPLMEVWHFIEPVLEKYYGEEGDFDMGGLNYSEMRAEIPLMFSGILEGSKRIKAIVEELREYARNHPAVMNETIQLNRVVESALILLSNMVNRSTVNFDSQQGKGLPSLTGNYQRLEQVVINLVQNACQALSDPGQAIRVRTYYDSVSKTVVLEVEDEGIGIEREILDRVTDPFFTTKRESGGTGLGLSISSRIVMEHGGRLSFESTPGEGTRARVRLPAAKTSGKSES